MINDSTQYIARISYGKDSLKMLDVIHSRGLPLDRITTTDVWATDTISAILPEMMEFKARMDQIIWSMYHIEVEHLCALNKDGSKKTYEQMFYHVPVRRSQSGQVERERETDVARTRSTGYREASQDSLPILATTGVKSSRFHPGTGIKGWPLSNKRLQWCQNLKIRVSTDFQQYGFPGAGENSKCTCGKSPFRVCAPRGAKIEISWNTWALLQTNPPALTS